MYQTISKEGYQPVNYGSFLTMPDPDLAVTLHDLRCQHLTFYPCGVENLGLYYEIDPIDNRYGISDYREVGLASVRAFSDHERRKGLTPETPVDLMSIVSVFQRKMESPNSITWVSKFYNHYVSLFSLQFARSICTSGRLDAEYSYVNIGPRGLQFKGHTKESFRGLIEMLSNEISGYGWTSLRLHSYISENNPASIRIAQYNGLERNDKDFCPSLASCGGMAYNWVRNIDL